MKILRFQHSTKHGLLLFYIAQCFFGVVLLCFLSLELNAQKQENQLCNFSANAIIECDNVNVQFSGNSTWPTHQWDFGDGTPILMGGSNLYEVVHTYHDINPYATPTPTAKHGLDGSFWCEVPLSDVFPGIFIGNGCSSTRTVSNLVATGTLPQNELQGKTCMYTAIWRLTFHTFSMGVIYVYAAEAS